MPVRIGGLSEAAPKGPAQSEKKDPKLKRLRKRESNRLAKANQRARAKKLKIVSNLVKPLKSRIG